MGLILKNIEVQKFAIFYAFLGNFCKKCEKELRIIFDKWSKRYFSLDAQPETQVFYGLYFMVANVPYLKN